jgi:hypothetical protein
MQYTASASLPQCPKCGAHGPHTVGDGTGPHTARLLCRQYGRFIQWLSTQSPDERTARRDSARRQWMQTQPVTERQTQYLRLLGHKGPPPRNRLEASEAIQHCLRQRGLES